MKPLYLTAALAAILLSCSKPSQETTDSDTTAVANTETEGDPNRVRTTLTADETERAMAEIFFFIRDNVIDSRGATYVEDFVMNGDKFKYTYIRHNGDNAGMQDNSYSGNTYYPTQEEIEAYEKDSINTPSPWGESYTRHEYYFIPDLDTFYIEGKYIVYLNSQPEVSPRNITIELIGEVVQKNAAEVNQDTQEVTIVSHRWLIDEYEGHDPEPFVDIDFGQEHRFSKDELYLKAKVMELTDKDFAGLSKEELSFVRNDIFARHGHTFKTPKMLQRYARAEWYHAVTDDASKVLNKTEKRNVDFIKKREG